MSRFTIEPTTLSCKLSFYLSLKKKGLLACFSLDVYANIRTTANITTAAITIITMMSSEYADWDCVLVVSHWAAQPVWVAPAVALKSGRFVQSCTELPKIWTPMPSMIETAMKAPTIAMMLLSAIDSKP